MKHGQIVEQLNSAKKKINADAYADGRTYVTHTTECVKTEYTLTFICTLDIVYCILQGTSWPRGDMLCSQKSVMCYKDGLELNMKTRYTGLFYLLSPLSHSRFNIKLI